MPSRDELQDFLERDQTPYHPRLDDRLNHLHRVTTWADDPRPLCVLAFDHRSQFEALAAESGGSSEDIGRFKSLMGDVLLEVMASGDDRVRHGAIVDHRYGREVLGRLAGAGIWLGSPVELPGSRPLDFDPHYAVGREISTWPATQIVKCLVFYHPDDSGELRHQQEEQIRSLFAEVVALERRLVLEVICPKDGLPVDDATLARALRRLYNLGVRPDWWKLESQTPDGWRAIGEVIRSCDAHCKGVVLLGQGADAATLRSGLTVAASFERCRGFAVGRSIFAEAAREWFGGRASDADAKSDIRQRYLEIIDIWCEAGGVR